ncbi:MexH family multidrug efflux RND transporter periplasmic adaptor subunit [Aliidongia dinghuensis]|uniref:MexH family multidrug efflux RND transporter periplasmic adaptor subunit n=1 Tax=Aliidongia dinghuensis TaxID=1867774 RepID=A0A8J3E4W5_9PROT|nr:efflux RND transporter periplasmic adaptor subunit [Aliidongia dinghuensis]GGF27759.1 MexH family multidrug efflux RND transporter periplasmic adaptor subunit [Aliidongia dinghuensis]
MAKRMIIMLVLVGVVLGGIFGFEAFRAKMIKQFLAGFGKESQTVAAVTAGMQEWQPQLKAVASFRAVNGADLSLEVSGIVDQIEFKSGDEVKAGTPLLTLRADDDVAKLHSLEAVAELARITYERDQKQFKVEAVSQQTLDSDAANLKNDLALAEQQRAIVAKKTVKAPFDGRLGIRQVDVGQYLNAGTTIVTLQALDPIFVDFTLPQQAFSQLKLGQKVTAQVDSYPGQSFDGELIAVDPKVDASTRNLQIRAAFKNPDRKLLPGMFATALIDTGAPEDFVTLPQSAITYNAFGSTVFLVEQKGKDDKGQALLQVRQTFVTTGDTRGDQVAVLKGVKQGDQVVTAGQVKLRNGSPVVVNNSVMPTADANPSIKDQ